MFRRKRKPKNRARKIDKAMPPVFVNVAPNYFDLSPEERREFLRAVIGGMSPNPEVRDRAEKTRKGFSNKPCS